MASHSCELFMILALEEDGSTRSCQVKTCSNGKEATVNRVLDGSMYPGKKLVHSVFGKMNYGGLKHNSLYLGLVLPSSG